MAKARTKGRTKWKLLVKPAPGEGFVIGHVRISSMGQDARSLEEQMEHITKDALKEGWQVVGWTQEPETSASVDEIEERPLFLGLLLEEAGKLCNVIITDETSRWARSQEVGNKSLRLLRERNCWWQTADGAWDINKPLTDGGAIMWAITGAQNEDYSRKISYHIQKGKSSKAREGYSNGTPMFGYIVPQLSPEEIQTITTSGFSRLRRRVVYEPDPQYFPTLERLGILLAEQSLKSYKQIGDILNEEKRFYFASKLGEIQPWTSANIARIVKRVYQREYAPGTGRGTIITPDGTLLQGWHQAAWSYETGLAIEENRRVLGERHRIGRRNVFSTFTALISCAHCHSPLVVRFSYGEIPVKLIKTGEVSDHLNRYAYYTCLRASSEYRKKEPCPARTTSRRAGIRLDVIEHQFGLILNLITPWREEEIVHIVNEYAHLNPEEADPIAEYQGKRLEFEQQRERVKDMYQTGIITKGELLKRMDDIRYEEAQLPVPTGRQVHNIQSYVDAIKNIATIGGQWSALVGKSSLRRKLVSLLLEPNGLIVDLVQQAIVGLRPKEDVFPIMKYTLGRYGWEEREPGLLWNEEMPRAVVPLHKNRFWLVMVALKKGLETSAQIAREQHIPLHSVNRVLLRMERQGYVDATFHEEGKHHWKSYHWIDDKMVPPDAFRMYNKRAEEQIS